MRALLVLVLALATLWAGYWVVGSITLQRAAENWFMQQTADGAIATNSALTVQGFPNRFDLTVTDLRLADPVSGFAWDVPFAQVFSMTWKPWHLIAALPAAQTITTPSQRIALGSSSLMGSLVMVPGTALALDRVMVDGADIAATSSSGWTLTAKRVALASRQDASLANGHEVNLRLTALTPDPTFTAAIAGTSDLPAQIDLAMIDLVAGFSAPIDRFAPQNDPRLTAVTVKDGQIRWGDMVLTASGSVTADGDGLAEGRIEFRLQNWRKLLAPAIALGLIKPEIAPTVEKMMEAIASQSEDTTVLDLPLVMQAGRMSLGPLPIGASPRLFDGPQG